MKSFEHFHLPAALIESLKRMKIVAPTPIQLATIPLALSGKDILASAQTGSGKTIAYAVPLIVKLLNNPQDTALILTPTRELATQVHQILGQIVGPSSSFKSALLIGGAAMDKQISKLRKHPQLIIGTPGRVSDHLRRSTLTLNKTSFLIVDEADCMLDMGFETQLNEIAKLLPATRQTLMFSATVPSNIERLSKKYLQNPERVAITTSTETAPKIKQEVLHTSAKEKFTQLLDQLIQRQGSVIIFTRTRRGAERLSKELSEHGHSTNAIHGDLSQRRRDNVIRLFRDRSTRILVATDVASRGLDIPHIMHVINYDPPQCKEDYVHRIGRTGRAGAEGNALCLISSEDKQKWKGIVKFLNSDDERDDEQKSRKNFSNRPKRNKPFFNPRQDSTNQKHHFSNKKSEKSNSFERPFKFKKFGSHGPKNPKKSFSFDKKKNFGPHN